MNQEQKPESNPQITQINTDANPPEGLNLCKSGTSVDDETEMSEVDAALLADKIVQRNASHIFDEYKLGEISKALGFDVFEDVEAEKKTLHILATEVRRLREELSHIMEVDEQEAQIASDKISALETSNKNLREQTQWRPMKSAPSDGKKMLLFFGIDDSIRIGHVGTCLYTDDGMKFYPTHWMPLPPAPEFRQDAQDGQDVGAKSKPSC